MATTESEMGHTTTTCQAETALLPAANNWFELSTSIALTAQAAAALALEARHTLRHVKHILSYLALVQDIIPSLSSNAATPGGPERYLTVNTAECLAEVIRCVTNLRIFFEEFPRGKTRPLVRLNWILVRRRHLQKLRDDLEIKVTLLNLMLRVDRLNLSVNKKSALSRPPSSHASSATLCATHTQTQNEDLSVVTNSASGPIINSATNSSATATSPVVMPPACMCPCNIHGHRTRFHQAAADGKLSLCREFLDAGASIDFGDENGETALHWAAWEGHPDVVRLLLMRGAEKDPRSPRYGTTPAAQARQRGYEDVAVMIEKWSGD